MSSSVARTVGMMSYESDWIWNTYPLVAAGLSALLNTTVAYGVTRL
jgi:hypothetical protein